MFHRRRIYLINRKFQFRFALYVCAWLLALTFIYPLIIAHIVANYIKNPLSYLQQQQILIALFLIQVVFLSLSFVISIFISHRIAGPIARLMKYFAEIQHGHYNHTLSLRKTDYFQELVPAYNEMLTAIQDTIKKKNESISAAIEALEKTMSNPSQNNNHQLEQIVINLRMNLGD